MITEVAAGDDCCTRQERYSQQAISLLWRLVKKKYCITENIADMPVRTAKDDIRTAPDAVRTQPDAIRTAPNNVRMSQDDIRMPPDNIRALRKIIRSSRNDIRRLRKDVRSEKKDAERNRCWYVCVIIYPWQRKSVKESCLYKDFILYFPGSGTIKASFR